MASSSSKNLYHRRQVAESAARACWICYKPSSTVLITPDQDDWFHLCPGHLADGKFAVAKDVEDLAQQKREQEIQREIDALKKEVAEKELKKLEKKQKKKDGEKKEDAAAEKKSKEEDAAQKEQNQKIEELEKQKQDAATAAAPGKVKIEGPRVFELQKHFFQMRMQKKRDAEVARMNAQRLRNPGTFPSVPTGNP